MSVYFDLLALSVYRGVFSRPVGNALLHAAKTLESNDPEPRIAACGELAAVLAKQDALSSLLSALAKEVLSDESPLAVTAAAHQTLSAETAEAAKRDLAALYNAAVAVGEVSASPLLPTIGNTPAEAPLDRPWGEQCEALSAWHATHGCGEFVFNTAFLWRNGSMKAVEHIDPIRLSDLKGYEQQQATACDNTLAFLDGFPANNVLLYGDRGTGKSSTVKAILNEYADRELRMIEVPKEYLHELPDLTDRLAQLPMKFIIFIDDLSFSGNDDNFSALKAVLEGGLATRPQNVLIYATSNRRHLVRERFDDREGNEVHAADTVQESVSLSDRFGITLTYIHPDQRRFTEMIRLMAEDMDIHLTDDRIYDISQKLISGRGARSPRFARQYLIDLKHRLTEL
ncbi:MAG: ATP-binding protein [Clostridia bacterium]|nr:ATP-binding protein [Clostridia bacterium]